MVRARKTSAVVAAVIFVAMTVGCSGGEAEPGTLPAASPALSNAPTASAASADTLDDEEHNAGTDTAQAALKAFLQRDLPYDSWWAQLKPMLTPEAVFAYEYTDPQSVPGTTITGEPLVSAAPSATQLNVLIPTGIGQYLIVLYRENARAGWAVDRLTPPEQAGP
ncbi:MULTISPECIES: hypothetical protein [Actinomycetes]|uniref:hypothetical protein n=1 Tax=Actinomycetes TaxID=1760 RepID=UPI0010A88A3C|nr:MULTISPECIES: hypothetical protein [Actinomycetes]